MGELLKDARFAHIAKDPKFRRIPKAERKVKIDKRFQGMFKDKKFTVTYTTDKRGRPVNQTTTENLRKYYDLSSNEEEDLDENTSVLPAIKKIKKKKSTKDTRNKEIKKKKTKTKDTDTNSLKEKKIVARETDTNSLNQESKDEQNNDKYFSSNENLSQVEPNKKHDQHFDDESDESSSEDNEDEYIQEGFAEVNLDENEKQLHKREKNESSKLTKEVKKKLKDLSVNYARGEGVLLTDSSSEEESSEASDEEIEHNWGELDKEAETTNDITYRLAICNMNWDVIRAVDLMILLNSFLLSGGLLRSVTIYPSEYGQQRMKEEEINGPMELKNSDTDNDDENEDNEEGAKYHMEKLRRYQLNRLKYYYAVAEFDSAETANKVYTECDGIEYESTANRLDLRFIPDDMIFDQEPKDTCNEIPEPAKYQPRQFTTTALQQVKVDLTWDDVDPDRQEFIEKANSGKLEDIDENDLHKYLASGSEDDSDAEEKKGNVDNEVDNNLDSNVKNDPIEKYKALLRSIEEEEKEEMKKKQDVELEVTWDIGAKEKVDKLMKEKIKGNEKLTPFEQYLEKRIAKKKAKREQMRHNKERQKNDSEDSLPSDIDTNNECFAEELKNGKSLFCKKQKRDDENEGVSNNEEDQREAELELLLMDENEDNGKKHFNMKEIEENATLSKSKRKRLSKKKKNAQEKTKEDTFEVDVKDPRFNALFTSHHYNIDPADSHYRKTKGTDALVNEKLKRRADNMAHVEDDEQFKKPRINEELPTELQALVKSVKRKTQNITQPIKR